MDMKLNDALSAYGRTASMQVDKLQDTADESAGTGGSSFATLVGNLAENAVNKTNQAESMTLKALTGEAGLTDLVTSINDAELAVQTIVAVRDKMINAYQDILKMPI